MITKEIRNKVEEKLQVDLNLRSENGRHLRYRHYVYSRALYYALCRDLTPLSLSSIGETLGQDHATVLHCIEKIHKNLVLWNEKKYLDVYDEISEYIKPLKEKIKEDLKKEKDYFALMKENVELKCMLDKAIIELNNEDNYIQKYIMVKTQLGFLKSAITKTNSLVVAEEFIKEIENIKEQ
jgi:hypothetical protein